MKPILSLAIAAALISTAPPVHARTGLAPAGDAAGLRWAWRLIQWACVLIVLLGAWGLATRPTAVPTASPIAVPQPPIVRPTT